MGPSYFDHLIEHPELVLVYDPPLRTFHTGCTRHPDARACWAAGKVPEKFACPFATGECLMAPLRGKRIRRVGREIGSSALTGAQPLDRRSACAGMSKTRTPPALPPGANAPRCPLAPICHWGRIAPQTIGNYEVMPQDGRRLPAYD